VANRLGWIKMKLAMEVGLGPSHSVPDGDPVPHSKRHSPNFRPVCCGQTAGCVKMQLGRQVRLGPGDTVLDGEPAPQKGAQQPPIFGPCIVA